MSTTTYIRERTKQHGVVQHMVIVPDIKHVITDAHCQAIDMDAEISAAKEEAA